MMTATNEEPLGPVPDVSVGFSDSVLLIVSIIGSIFLAYTVHSIVYTKLKSAEEIEEEELTYDEQLIHADVSTLNRAQRRARARQIMKQQRRITPAATLADVDDNNMIEDENPFEPITAAHLSRKERQKAAKSAEKEERKLFEDERRREQQEAQKIAQKEKQERETRMMQQAEADRKARQERREAEEKAAYQKWKTFLSSPNC